MEGMLGWGIEVVLWFQQFSPGLDFVFKGLTFLGNQEFYLAFLPLIYWCIDRHTGARLFIVLLFTAYLNAVAKVLLNQPRPFNYDPRVKPLVHAVGGGLPSGHTQTAVTIWGYLACRIRKPLFWIITGFLLVGIPLSRIYLGVHFPTDVLGGYILGGLILILFLVPGPRIERWLKCKSFMQQFCISLALPIFLIILNFTGDPYVLTIASALMGAGAGFVLERRLVRFRVNGPLGKRIARYLLGVAIMFGLWIGLRSAFSGVEPVALFRFLRYFLVGLWGSLGAPWVFAKLGLVEQE
ncbi:MAG: phosphatase PAP2 family protein [Desulfobacterales bacterium]|nr:phosphatase PAP2 family protein [Desulfobacterales bacterium]